MPPITPPMIAPVLFGEESPLLMLLVPVPLFVSLAGAASGFVAGVVVECVLCPGVLPIDASVDLDDDESADVVVFVAVGSVS
jgi:hypothetical protein